MLKLIKMFVDEYVRNIFSIFLGKLELEHYQSNPKM